MYLAEGIPVSMQVAKLNKVIEIALKGEVAAE